MEFPDEYILAIYKDNVGALSLREIALPTLFPELILVLERMRLSEETTVNDMQRAFRSFVSPNDISFDYSYYGQIGGSNTSGQSYPQIYEYTDKTDFMQMVKQYLWAMSYTETVIGLQNNPSVVLWSWLDHGYAQKEIAISEHLKVTLLTNFGYGLKSYFSLSIYYRDILILPYYHVVEYLNVREYGLSSFNYNIDKPGIDVWRDAFSKVIEIANISEAEFVNKWIISQLLNLLNDMSMLLDRPESAVGYYFGDNKVELTSLYRHFYKPQIMKKFKSEEEYNDWYWSTISDKISDTVAMMRHASNLMPFVPDVEKMMLKAKNLYHRALPLLEFKKAEYSTIESNLLDKAGKGEYSCDETMNDINIKREVEEKLVSAISDLRTTIIK